jgi:peptidoglycan hydrolase-like protein with peptidoglycan-binding domain
VQQAIRDFQIQNNLPVDGTLNPPTQDRAADLVKTLQIHLNRVIKLNPQLPGSQFYGKQTESAVRLFQQQSGLPMTGIATIETRQRLKDQINDATPRIESSVPNPTPTPTPTPSAEESIGIYSEAQLKAVLLGFGYQIDPQAPLSEARSRTALREIQQLYGLSETGQADPATQEILSKVVRSLRSNLRAILKTNLPITPFYDAATRSTVRKFQTRYGLQATGLADLGMRSRIDQVARGMSRR